MLGAFEHQVLEQVREPGAPRLFVLRSDVIPDVDGHHRQLVVFMNNDVEAVGEFAFAERDLHPRLSSQFYRWRRNIAYAPSNGPGTSSNDANCQLLAAATRGSASIVTIVNRKPRRVCSVSAVPT